MNREDYLQMRITKQFDLLTLYKYYTNKNKGQNIEFNIFQQTFPIFLQSNIRKITDKLDSEFKIDVLYDVDGKELRFY